MIEREEIHMSVLCLMIERALRAGCTQSDITEITREIQQNIHKQNHAFPFGLSSEDFTLAHQIASGVPHCHITWMQGKPTGAIRARVRRIRDRVGVSSSEEMYLAFLANKIQLLPFPHKKEPKPVLIPSQIKLLKQLHCGDSVAALARQFGEPETNLHGRVSKLMKKLGVRSRIELVRYWKEVLEPTLPQD